MNQQNIINIEKQQIIDSNQNQQFQRLINFQQQTEEFLLKKQKQQSRKKKHNRDRKNDLNITCGGLSLKKTPSYQKKNSSKKTNNNKCMLKQQLVKKKKKTKIVAPIRQIKYIHQNLERQLVQFQREYENNTIDSKNQEKKDRKIIFYSYDLEIKYKRKYIKRQKDKDLFKNIIKEEIEEKYTQKVATKQQKNLKKYLN
ncbi:hypothetical protein ABPG74_002771 [Tetrahymena malaccensis]